MAEKGHPKCPIPTKYIQQLALLNKTIKERQKWERPTPKRGWTKQEVKPESTSVWLFNNNIINIYINIIVLQNAHGIDRYWEAENRLFCKTVLCCGQALCRVDLEGQCLLYLSVGIVPFFKAPG